jgi:hypothetical protein
MKFLPIIMSHGRADCVLTYKSLRRIGFTDRILILIDNEDKRRAEYESEFGDEVYVFDKKAWAKKTDSGDNFPHRKAIVYARNACYSIAKELGYRWFIQLDDDYDSFLFKFDENLKYKEVAHNPKIADAIKHTFLFLRDTPAISAIAWAQNGDFMGGAGSSDANRIWLKRKCMNTWFCDTERPINFVGHMNEDASAYIVGGIRGQVFLQTNFCAINQAATQAAAGGMTDTYKANGTYLKTFYSIMQTPACVRVSVLGRTHDRIHHKILWNNCAPKILRESVRKL